MSLTKEVKIIEQPYFDILEHHEGSIYCLDISKDEELIATGGQDNRIKLTVDPLKANLQNSEILFQILEAHWGKVRSICFLNSDDFRLISCGDNEDTIHVWDNEDENNINFAGHKGGTVSLSVFDDYIISIGL